MRRIFLLFAAIGLTPIALSYGAAPSVSLPWLFEIDAAGVNIRHIFRAVMGLYLGLVCFWIAGAFRDDLRVPALWSLFVFMMGLALGRLLSLLIDGWPHPLLVLYMALEFVFAFLAWRLLVSRRADLNPKL
jgi:hypothetical protein